MSSERFIRAYCPTHKTSTTAAAAPVIVCESDGHALSQNFPHAEFWEYCCDCQSFRPSEIAASGRAQERCMVCDRQVARRFLCEHCQVISIESDEAAKRRKPYVVNAAGAVEPACPGCLRADGRPVHAHACREVDATLTTAREVCPFCNDPVRPKPAPAPAFTTPLAPHAGGEPAETRYCFNCGAPAPNEFCGRCGAPQASGDVERDPRAERREEPAPAVNVTAPIVNPATPVAGRPPSPAVPDASGSSAKGVFVFLAVVVALVAVVAVAVSLSKKPPSYNSGTNSYNSNASYSESTETKLERAISQGNLVEPSGSSAQDYYDQLAGEGASSSKLSGFRERLLPMLKEKPMRLLSDLYEPGSPDSPLYEWEEAAKLAAWASRLAPNDSALEARAAFCEGRVAYHNRNMSEARRLWQRAGELDTSWALPVNGIGLTYVDSTNSDKNKWVEARPYYNEAIRRDSSWAVPYNNLGTSYLRTKDLETARSYYKRAAALAPRWARPHAWLGDIAMTAQDCTTAVEEYKAALELDPVSRPGWNLTEIRQKYDKAVAGSGCYY
jgi:tetratricopeptide (TPR) repeat protein